LENQDQVERGSADMAVPVHARERGIEEGGNETRIGYTPVLQSGTPRQNGSMVSLALFVASVVIGWLVVRYRVRVIVVVQQRTAKSAARPGPRLSRPALAARKRSDFWNSEQAPEIATALMHRELSGRLRTSA
jgi:hypothetical protein